jgi:hypothetical protein
VSNYYILPDNTSKHCVRLHYTLLHTLLCASTTQSLQMCALFTHHFRKSADAKLLHSSIPDHEICRFDLQRTNTIPLIHCSRGEHVVQRLYLRWFRLVALHWSSKRRVSTDEHVLDSLGFQGTCTSCIPSSRDEHSLYCFTLWNISICCTVSPLERLACVSLIDIRDISRCRIASFVERWADVAFFHSGRDEDGFCSSTLARRACVALLHSLKDEQMLHSSTPGETSVCFIDHNCREEHERCCILSLLERGVCSIDRLSADEHVLDCFIRWEMSRCYIIPLRERRAYVLFINIRETCMCWITSLVETWASVAFFHSERDERVFYSHTFERHACVGLLHWLRHEQVLHSFTPRETSAYSIHQHSRDMHVLDCFIRWEMSRCYIIPLRERRAYVPFINIRETRMCWIASFVERWADVI